MRINISDHTADIILSVSGNSLEELISGMILGLSKYIWGDITCTSSTDKLMIKGDGPDMTFAFATLLSDLLYHIEVSNVNVLTIDDIAYRREEGNVFIKVEVTICKEKSVGKMSDVKAVSFSMDWNISIILDL